MIYSIIDRHKNIVSPLSNKTYADAFIYSKIGDYVYQFCTDGISTTNIGLDYNFNTENEVILTLSSYIGGSKTFFIYRVV